MNDASPATDRRPAALPDDAILLHIGLHKTGTTSLQTQLAAARDALLAHGVTYPGQHHAHHRAAMALVDTVWGWDPNDPVVNERIWQNFATSVSETPGKILVSSEFFCQADDAQARKAVDTLGADRVHVVVAFRHLGELLPSSWQQYLKTGRSTTYTSWLKHVLADPPGNKLTPSFWRRNDVPDVLRRWTEAVGPDRVTVVVAETSERERLPRTVTDLLGVPESVLQVQTDDLRSNRSMTAEESELIRRINVWARKALPSPRYTQLMRNGGATHMVESRRPAPGETRLGLPEWAAPRVLELAEQHVAAIETSGAQIVGDPAVLARPIETVEVPAVELVPLDAAVEAVIGVLAKTELYYDSPTMGEFRTRQLAGEVVKRSRRVSKRAMRPLARREDDSTPEDV